MSEVDNIRGAAAEALQQSEAGLHQAQVILVMLDALLDTRLGTLHQLNRNAAVQMLHEAGYFQRANDNLAQINPDIDNDAFEAAYAARSADVLMDSMLTPMVMSVSHVAFELEEQRINTPFVETVEVRVNLWPYVLSVEECDELAAAMTAYLPYDVRVTTCFIPVKDMTVEALKREYSGVVLYDLAEWFKMHGREFETVSMPAVTMWAPKLHANGGQAFKVGDLGEEFDHLEPYSAIERFISPLVALELLDVEYFSILRPSRVKALYNARLAQRIKEQEMAQTPDTQA